MPAQSFIPVVHHFNSDCNEGTIIIFIPNTAVFGPTNFIETIASTTTTARMKISDDEDF